MKTKAAMVVLALGAAACAEDVTRVHFEFEGRSAGERVKFYGVNLVGSGKKV